MQQQYPQKPGLDFILKKAFSYWSQTIGLQVMFSIVYFGIFMTVFFYFETKYNIVEDFVNVYMKSYKIGSVNQSELQNNLALIFDRMEFQYFLYGILGAKIFLYPLNIGFYQIYRKMDLKEEITLSDLFVGYSGINFFKFLSYYIFWIFPFIIMGKIIVLPFIWVLLTIFGAPLMFFENKRIFEILAIGWKALKTNFIEIFVCCLVATVFVNIGFIFFLIGGLFTFPFWNAMIYSLYSSIFTEEKWNLE